jgi:2-polyprenyl-3-methyl-5-hydroxy-6-metoxy-1,4-benzoquinol methylase
VTDADRERASTADREYADRLRRLGDKRWKRLLGVQAPFRWNVRRLHLGRTLDIGCGIGRNLAHLDGNGVGVDHNPASIATARARGLEAYTVDEFGRSPAAVPRSYDSMLLAHVVEHMGVLDAITLIRTYLSYLKPTGQVCLITPQESGYRSDPTHVRFVDFDGLAELADAVGLHVTRQYSFPLPRSLGRVFRYNEFVQVATWQRRL